MSTIGLGIEDLEEGEPYFILTGRHRFAGAALEFMATCMQVRNGVENYDEEPEEYQNKGVDAAARAMLAFSKEMRAYQAEHDGGQIFEVPERCLLGRSGV